ncbi:hypothetical protein FB45DRAFT_1063009 [Roridomyces roridus]|uniref:F-box domain-containing protein n=1 Tax=Roridomyces roridus TaxID=1738132 RepID=A0AAD7BG38_9AGAR|nr:hypothetical protein FB45DRAFT_1063009 [Roridomyces roridus]
MRNRSPQRAQICITLWLPNEVLTEIIQNAPVADQATLCRVSKLFHGLVLPCLLREVALNESETLESFSLAMRKNPERADLVRSLTYRNWIGSSHRNSLFLIAAMKLMQRLEYLSINDDGWVVSQLADVSFPNLSSYAIQLSPNFSLLPNLRCYAGPPRFLSSFCFRNLGAVQMLCPPSFASVLEVLRAQADPDLILSLNHNSSLEAQVYLRDTLATLSGHMLYFKKLQLQGCHESVSLAPETINNITAYLSRSDRIEYFALHYWASPENNSVKIRGALETWVNACSTLRGCCFGEIAWVKVGEKWEECSREEFDTESGFSVFV